jgi:hypothetical protein
MFADCKVMIGAEYSLPQRTLCAALPIITAVHNYSDTHKPLSIST